MLFIVAILILYVMASLTWARTIGFGSYGTRTQRCDLKAVQDVFKKCVTDSDKSKAKIDTCISGSRLQRGFDDLGPTKSTLVVCVECEI